MNFNKNTTIAKQKTLKSSKHKISSKISVMSFRMLLILFITGILVGSTAVFGVLNGLIDTAPSIDSINVMPSGYATTIYDKDGQVLQKLVGKDANRIYVSIDEIPESVQNSFIAIEDSRFWSHNGIDVYGIFRAFFSGLTSEDRFSEGASTLTQQLLKNQVFEGGKETSLMAKIQRKVQEQYLAIQLENKLEKKQILEYYLNTINLGQNTLGIQAASKRYFNKEAKDLTISEASVIAGITQNPSAYNPIAFPQNNKEKRAIVLEYMKQQKLISEDEYQTAIDDDVYSRIQFVNDEQYSSADTAVTTYFDDALFNQVLTDLKEKLGYTETQAYNALYRGGLEIYSTQDSTLQAICDETLQDEANFPADSEWSLSYRLSIKSADGIEQNYDEQTLKAYYVTKNSTFDIYFKDKEKAEPYIKEYRNHIVKDTDTILGEVINYVIQPQVSFVLMDQTTGQVNALVGGRGKKTGSRTLNRATDSLRQPGSTFKVLSTYLPALDTSGMTLATIQDDETYFYPGTKKQVSNWSGNYAYKGLTTLRQAIYDSMNVVTVKTYDQVTPKTGFDYLINLGFTTLVDSMTDSSGRVFSDIQLPTALGGITNGVTNMELTAAFASIANAGVYTEPILYSKILDHDGNLLLERKPITRQVMKDSTAFLLTSAMEDVVNKGTGTPVKFTTSDMPVAGKTGTTSSDYDLWFVGYTPYYTAGIWGGYDLNKDQTITTYHKTIWKKIMEKVTLEKNQQTKAFAKPSSIVSAEICTKSGKLAVHGLCDLAPGGSTVRTEYFAKGTEPTETCDSHVKYSICKASGKLAGANCPLNQVKNQIFLIKDKDTGTADTPYLLPKGLADSICNVH